MKDEKLIPNGIYCYGCPYYKYIETIQLFKNNGEICPSRNECKEECGTTDSTSCTIKIIRCEYMDYTDYTEDTLLWDMVKECGVNDEIIEEDYK